MKKCPKCGRSLVGNDDCMFCHIVPVTYQKKWAAEEGKSNIYYFDKELNPVEKDYRYGNKYEAINGGNAKNFMGEWDYYIITDDEREYVDAPSRHIEEFFDKNVENDWSAVYELFIEENLHKKKKAPSEIISPPLYDFWKKTYEINNEVAFGVSFSDLEAHESTLKNLDKFLLMQYLRRFENMKQHFEKIFQLLPSDHLVTDEDKRICYLKILADCAASGNENNTLKVVLPVIDVILSRVVIFAPEKTKFILSDNPVIYNLGNSIDKKIAGGLYMAITPDVAIAFLDLSEWRKIQPEMKIKDLLLVAETDDFVSYFNGLLLDKTVSTVGFNSPAIKDHIAEDMDKSYSFNVIIGSDD